MAIRLGDEAPNFTAETTEGTINFHEWLGGGWGILFSHPKDYTPVCTTELGTVAKITPEFKKRGVKVIAVSVELAIVAFAVVTFWRGVVYPPILFARNTPVLGLPGNVVSAAVPVAYASILLAAVERLWNLVRR